MKANKLKDIINKALLEDEDKYALSERQLKNFSEKMYSMVGNCLGRLVGEDSRHWLSSSGWDISRQQMGSHSVSPSNPMFEVEARYKYDNSKTTQDVVNRLVSHPTDAVFNIYYFYGDKQLMVEFTPKIREVNSTSKTVSVGNINGLETAIDSLMKSLYTK